MAKEWKFKNGSKILFGEGESDPFVGIDIPYIYIEDSMINIVVYSEKTIDVEVTSFTIETKDDMVLLLKEIINKCKYSGESICLETADIDTEKGISKFTEIERW